MMEDDGDIQKFPPGAVECDPKKRYWRFEDVLGRGAFKTVFKAFDSREGLEVAWNKVQLGTAVNENQLRRRLFGEINVLKRLKHKNIMTFHDYWLDDKTSTLNFITELFTHGSLKKFRAKHKHLELKVLKKWAWQVLQGLVYLHGHDPPILHRDLKCDNILINGVTGDLKIGDLGLATLWRGLAPLSVIGTPEFMAPEFYDEKYDEKVDVYAFGMLLLELVSMDYPYCECTNPAAIYKKVSQGVFPASIQKIRNEELRKFIELCIAYEPFERPEARKLLKHPFFDGIRKSMEPDRQPSEEIDMDHFGRGSDTSGSSESSRVDLLSRQTSAAFNVATDSEEDSEDDARSESTSDGVKIRIECSKVEGEPILNFTLKYDRPGGDLKTIRFPFDIEDDTAEQIVAEMRAEGAIDLDMMISEEEASTIGHLIALEVERWKLKDEGELMAYVNVTRKQHHDSTQESQQPVDSAGARGVLESKMDDMCSKMASDLDEDNIFRTLHANSRDLMDYVAADNCRRSMKQKLETQDEEMNSEDVLTETNVLFPSKSENAAAPSAPIRAMPDRQDPSSAAIEIPKRASSRNSLDQSHSFSSSVSGSGVGGDVRGSAISRSIQRRLSERKFLSEGPSMTSRPSVLRSMSMTVDNKPTESPCKVGSPGIPVGLSVVVVEPSQEVDTSSGAGQERAAESETGQDARPGMNTSLISMVTMKQPKKAVEASMPTVPELPSTQLSNASSPVAASSEQRPDDSASQSKVEDNLTSNPFLADPESAANVSQSQSAGVAPSSPPKRPESCGGTVDHGIKSPVKSQAAHDKASLAPQLRITEGVGNATSQSSRGFGDVRDQPDDQDQALTSDQAPTQAMKAPRRSREYLTSHSKQSSLTDALDIHQAFSTSPPQHCRSAFEHGVSWASESIRAFRRDEEEETTMMDEAEQNIDRMFNSCADLAHLWADDSGMKHDWLFASTPCFDNHVLRHSRSDISLLRLAEPHPFLNLAPPVNPRGRYSGGVRMKDTLEHYHSDELPSWVEIDDDYFVVDKRKNENADKKLTSSKAPETIVKVPEREWTRLCSTASSADLGATIEEDKSERPPVDPWNP